ncbi:hypothetical protein [Hymenobacter metallicola]|uniref:Uncharacterized protein n=1 Tax=Hymenobacter metallicola TaxID=2563114 RepID=A0A4Z0Q8Y7_9BACT|nr:hypothetical protein [Hymenobacter metallicola]TGE26470.1 hypothetical protein E5K02_16900 [Hymenobacter metallicola]
MIHPDTYFRATMLSLGILCTGCDKESTSVYPSTAGQPTAAGSAAAQGGGALVAKNYFQVGMCTCLTGLAAGIDMTQSNYVETPSGNRTSVWTGLVPEYLMPPLTLNPTTGVSSYTYNSYWNGDGDGIYYVSKCIITSDRIATLTLHSKK